jgi:Holliday junction resolvase RusA-like endonuclease
MTDVLVFNVNGTPAPQGSKRARAIYKGRGKAREFTGRVAQVEMSKKVKPWRQAVVDAAQHAIGAVGMFDDWVPYTGPVHVAIEFRIRRPLSHYRTGRFANLLRDNAPDFVITAPDTDKACRSTLDALTQAKVYGDDRQVASLSATKVYCDRTDPAGATIIVRPVSWRDVLERAS